MSEIAIRVENLSKKYTIPATQRHDTLCDQLSYRLKSVFHRNGRAECGDKTFWALKDVSFEIKEGEIVGIIGHNGAGKSTLLKILSQITLPTQGRSEIYGRVGSLLEVGTGFHPELTGRENIFLNGAIIGMTKAEINLHFDAIVDFSEVEQFIDMPVKRYSSGMYVKLAFAVSAHLKPEILMIDEVLSVGDLQFQRKCMAYIEELRKSNSTILFVSHNMFAVKAMCNRVILLSEGKICFDGSAEDGIKLYEGPSKTSALPWAQNAIGADPSQWDVFIENVETFDETGMQRDLFNYGERIRIRLGYTVRKIVSNPNFLVSFIRSDDVACCNYNTAMDGFSVPSLETDGMIELLTPPLNLVSESYKIFVLVRDAKFENLYCAQVGKTFHVRHDVLNTHFGVFHEQGEWFLPNEVVDHKAFNFTGGLLP
ncbi:MAG: ABC transporter ATP-binding protein [Desulfuromonadaceae bacterium]|nr:ABC transporter ATP-binding protein [Desulfuromonadaceae bacterium]